MNNQVRLHEFDARYTVYEVDKQTILTFEQIDTYLRSAFTQESIDQARKYGLNLTFLYLMPTSSQMFKDSPLYERDRYELVKMMQKPWKHDKQTDIDQVPFRNAPQGKNAPMEHKADASIDDILNHQRKEINIRIKCSLIFLWNQIIPSDTRTKKNIETMYDTFVIQFVDFKISNAEYIRNEYLIQATKEALYKKAVSANKIEDLPPYNSSLVVRTINQTYASSTQRSAFKMSTSNVINLTEDASIRSVPIQPTLSTTNRTQLNASTHTSYASMPQVHSETTRAIMNQHLGSSTPHVIQNLIPQNLIQHTQAKKSDAVSIPLASRDGMSQATTPTSTHSHVIPTAMPMPWTTQEYMMMAQRHAMLSEAFPLTTNPYFLMPFDINALNNRPPMPYANACMPRGHTPQTCIQTGTFGPTHTLQRSIPIYTTVSPLGIPTQTHTVSSKQILSIEKDRPMQSKEETRRTIMLHPNQETSIHYPMPVTSSSQSLPIPIVYSSEAQHKQNQTMLTSDEQVLALSPTYQSYASQSLNSTLVYQPSQPHSTYYSSHHAGEPSTRLKEPNITQRTRSIPHNPLHLYEYPIPTHESTIASHSNSDALPSSVQHQSRVIPQLPSPGVSPRLNSPLVHTPRIDDHTIRLPPTPFFSHEHIEHHSIESQLPSPPLSPRPFTPNLLPPDSLLLHLQRSAQYPHDLGTPNDNVGTPVHNVHNLDPFYNYFPQRYDDLPLCLYSDEGQHDDDVGHHCDGKVQLVHPSNISILKYKQSENNVKNTSPYHTYKTTNNMTSRSTRSSAAHPPPSVDASLLAPPDVRLPDSERAPVSAVMTELEITQATGLITQIKEMNEASCLLASKNQKDLLDLRSQIDAQRSTIEALNIDLSTSNSAKSTLNDSNSTLVIEVDSLKQLVTANSTASQALLKEYESTTTQLKIAKDLLHKEAAERQDLSNRLANLQTTVNHDAESTDRARTTHDALVASSALIDRDLKTSNTALDVAKTELDTVCHTIEEMKQDQLKNYISKKEFKAKRKELQDSVEEVSVLTDTLKKANTKLKAGKAVITQVRKVKETMLKQLADMNESCISTYKNLFSAFENVVPDLVTNAFIVAAQSSSTASSTLFATTKDYLEKLDADTLIVSKARSTKASKKKYMTEEEIEEVKANAALKRKEDAETKRLLKPKLFQPLRDNIAKMLAIRLWRKEPSVDLKKDVRLNAAKRQLDKKKRGIFARSSAPGWPMEELFQYNQDQFVKYQHDINTYGLLRVLIPTILNPKYNSAEKNPKIKRFIPNPDYKGGFTVRIFDCIDGVYTVSDQPGQDSQSQDEEDEEDEEDDEQDDATDDDAAGEASDEDARRAASTKGKKSNVKRTKSSSSAAAASRSAASRSDPDEEEDEQKKSDSDEDVIRMDTVYRKPTTDSGTDSEVDDENEQKDDEKKRKVSRISADSLSRIHTKGSNGRSHANNAGAMIASDDFSHEHSRPSKKAKSGTGGKAVCSSCKNPKKNNFRCVSCPTDVFCSVACRTQNHRCK